jgi:hypothetical protein
MPFRYLLSGGVSWRSLVPSWSFSLWRTIENLLQPWMRHLAMFVLIVLSKDSEVKGDSGSVSSDDIK